jgi:hypothetical protein
MSKEDPNIIAKFVSCCDGTEILFSGSIALSDGEIYQYIGAAPATGFGGQLLPNYCYTYFREVVDSLITYPTSPTSSEFDGISENGCASTQCADCNPEPLCNCPEGFTYDPIGENCVRETETVAEYSGVLLPVTTGSKSQFYCDFGVRVYPDITSLTWPLYGENDTTYIVKQNNGLGLPVNPTNNVENEVFGSRVAGCISGNTGGRLNIAGVWATGFDVDEELSFEFCIDIDGTEDKQYMIGIAGDNYVKFYIDGVLAVFLDSPAGETTPFRRWHTFPLTLSPGNHIIKLSGLNKPSSGVNPAAFAAEIYDITLSEFQANLLYPAVGLGNCGSTEAQLDPYIIFSTKNYVGQFVPDPNNPGIYSCPGDSVLDICQGIPVCKLTETLPLECDCYLIIPCDDTVESFISIDPLYADYVGTFNQVDGPEYSGCAYITTTDTEFCSDTTTTTVPIPEASCDCDLKCYFVQGNAGFFYVNENNDFLSISSIEASPYIRICSKIPPIPEEGSNIDNFKAVPVGDCVDGFCPDLCFELKSCESDEIIYSNSDVLYQYAFGTDTVIEILGKEGCWEVNLEDDPVSPACECLIDIVVVRSYVECEDCIKFVYYKLTSCTDTTVIYTELNLELFVGKVIKTDCGCYDVELIDFKPPNTQLIQISGLFEECIDCTRKYYELVDCKGEADNIYTYTELSSVVGNVIKIENCTECWTVNIVENSELIYQEAGEVVVTETYADCIACEGDLVCTCSQVTNHSETITKPYQYLNCDNELVTITLGPGESSGRICILEWLPGLCECITLTVEIERVPITYIFIIVGYDENGIPIYGNEGTEVQIYWNGKVWQFIFNDEDYQLDGVVSSSECPIGTWDGNENIITEECLDPVPTIDTDFFETFGECKHGVCPPRTFPNKRVITPGYNTPICTPEKYDMITCNFADVMYNIVLEKRYGITNCCPEEVHKWMVKKELIDLQALKDPDYKCSECNCNSNSTNDCTTCKSKN